MRRDQVLGGGSHVFVLTHRGLDKAHAALGLGILDLGVRSAGGKSDGVLPAPRQERFAHEFVVRVDEFELHAACCNIILDALE